MLPAANPCSGADYSRAKVAMILLGADAARRNGAWREVLRRRAQMPGKGGPMPEPLLTSMMLVRSSQTAFDRTAHTSKSVGQETTPITRKKRDGGTRGVTSGNRGRKPGPKLALVDNNWACGASSGPVVVGSCPRTRLQIRNAS